MSHKLSLQCYLEARESPEIHLRQYQDLEAILLMFELIDARVRSPERPEPNQFRTPNLVLVEDDVDITDMLQMGLVKNGYPQEAIQVFSSGEDAVGFVKRNHVDIALLDIRLVSPVAVRGEYMSGLQVLQAIKDTSPAAKVILITGFATYAMACEGILEMGASYCLRKPFDLSDVLRIVDWAIFEAQNTHG